MCGRAIVIAGLRCVRSESCVGGLGGACEFGLRKTSKPRHILRQNLTSACDATCVITSKRHGDVIRARSALHNSMSERSGWRAFERRSSSARAVEIVGLQGRPELNGRVGTPISFDAAKGRYKVKLHDDEMLAVKPANLRRLDPTPASLRWFWLERIH